MSVVAGDVFCHVSAFIDHGNGIAGIYATTKPFYKNNISRIKHDLVLFILSAIQGGHNMKIRCNQNCTSCKNLRIGFQCLVVQGILNVLLALFGISTLPLSTFWDFHLTARWTKKGSFPTLQLSSKTRRPNFQCMRDKKYIRYLYNSL